MTSKTKHENVDRLPQWAQRLIRQLEMRLDEAKNEIQALFPLTNSNTLYRLSDMTHPLPPNSTILVFTGDDTEDHIVVRIEKGHLNISATHRIAISPQATNTVHITTLPWSR